MDNASKNAGDMIGSLQMQYNRGRQAAITNELVDIITGKWSLTKLAILSHCFLQVQALYNKWQLTRNNGIYTPLQMTNFPLFCLKLKSPQEPVSMQWCLNLAAISQVIQ